jgi:hypothetical protein
VVEKAETEGATSRRKIASAAFIEEPFRQVIEDQKY